MITESRKNEIQHMVDGIIMNGAAPDLVDEILEEQKYSDEEIRLVKKLVRKRGFSNDRPYTLDFRKLTYSLLHLNLFFLLLAIFAISLFWSLIQPSQIPIQLCISSFEAIIIGLVAMLLVSMGAKYGFGNVSLNKALVLGIIYAVIGVQVPILRFSAGTSINMMLAWFFFQDLDFKELVGIGIGMLLTSFFLAVLETGVLLLLAQHGILQQ